VSVVSKWRANTSSSGQHFTSMFCLSAAECRAAGLFTGYSASLALTSPLHARAIDNHADHNIVVNSPVDPTRAAAVPASAADRLTDRPWPLARRRRNGIKWSEKQDAHANANWHGFVNVSSEMRTSSTSRRSDSHETTDAYLRRRVTPSTSYLADLVGSSFLF